MARSREQTWAGRSRLILKAPGSDRSGAVLTGAEMALGAGLSSPTGENSIHVRLHRVQQTAAAANLGEKRRLQKVIDSGLS